MKVVGIISTLLAMVLIAQSKLEPRFAPYIYTGMDLVGLHQKYGLKAVTLAFVLANTKEPKCVPFWDGYKNLDDKDSIDKIKAFEAVGGKVIVASGGGAGKYLETYCTTPAALAGVYKKVLAVTGSTHLDLDIEHGMNEDVTTQAIAQVQKENPAVTFSLTIAADARGITAQGISILKSAIKHGVNVDIVNTMAMDFESPKTWGGAVADVGEATHKQLKQIWPQKSDAELYSMIGLTPMIGRNDEGKVFTQDDAQKVVEYAKSKGIGHLAFWALGRDNGKCPNEKGNPSDECSGIKEADHEFTKIFSQFDK